MQLYTVSNVMRRRQGSRTCGLFDAADDERISNSLDVLTGFDFGSDDESNDAVAFVGHFPTVISIGHHPTTKAKNIDPFVESSSHKQELLIVSTFYTLNSKTHNSKSILSLLILNILIECNNNNNHQNK